MDELFGPRRRPAQSQSLFLATVGAVSASGTTLEINGQPATSTPFKRVVTGQTLSAGDLVLVAEVGGGYVIIGKIAN